MLVYDPKTAKVWDYNGRETAPAGVTPEMFLDPETGEPLRYFDALPRADQLAFLALLRCSIWRIKITGSWIGAIILITPLRLQKKASKSAPAWLALQRAWDVLF